MALWLGAMSEVVVPLELAEIGAFADLYRSASPEVVGQCGVALKELDESVVLAATRLDVLALNRVLGLGLTGRPSDAGLAQMVETVETIGSARFFVQVAPTEWSADVASRLMGLGLRHHNNWIRLTRELVHLPVAPAGDLAVQLIGPKQADVFSRIVAAAYGHPPEVAPLTGCVIGRPGWRHYLAYEDDEAIAAGAMFVAGEAAWLGFAATAAERRGRGAQTALVVRRLEDAAADGCKWVSVETAEQTPEREAPSFRNLSRLGFTVAYTRPNYVWVR